MLEPDNGYHYYLFARSLQAQGKYTSALEAVNQAILYTDKPKHYYFKTRGWLHWFLQDYEAAIQVRER